jgi:hypothetical protein
VTPPCGHTWSWPDSAWRRQLGLGVAAMSYIQLGYAVLPLMKGGKKPHEMIGHGGVMQATLDPQQVTSWWAADPGANIGVATGERSRLLVVDLDVREEPGPANLAQFMHGYGVWLPGDAPVARTPSGGSHVWLAVPPGLPSPTRQGILPGVDIKGGGGYVVAAPSMLLAMPAGLDGEIVREMVPVPYWWASGCPCSAPRMPEWVSEWLASAPAQRARPGPSDPLGELSYYKEHGIPRGERNKTMHRLACQLFRLYGTETTVVLTDLRAVWDQTDKTDFTWSEALGTVQSARNFVRQSREREDRMIADSSPWLRKYTL